MLPRFSSRLDMLLLGLSDALLHPIAILLHQIMETLCYMQYPHPQKFVPMWHSAERFAPWCFIDLVKYVWWRGGGCYFCGVLWREHIY